LEDKLGKKKMASMGEKLDRALVACQKFEHSLGWMYLAYHHLHPTLTERLKALKAYTEEKKKKEE